MLQRGNLLVFGKQLLLKLLVLFRELIGTLACCIGLYTESVEFLIMANATRRRMASVCLWTRLSELAPCPSRHGRCSGIAYLFDAVLS